MALDVVPALNESIDASFKANCMSDRQLAKITARVRDGTATLVDGHDYAERLGVNLSKAFKSNMTAETLPNGTLYYNIATRTVTPALQQNYELVNDLTSDIQKTIDEASGIGLNSIRADFPDERIKGLIDKMTAEGITLEDALKWLEEPIINNSEAFFDDYVKENAKFRNDVGLKATLTRKTAWGCCEWCAALSGTYDYNNAPADIYRRHEFCRCVVTYKSGKQKQDVWSKRTWQTSQEDLSARSQINNMVVMDAQERINQAERLMRDQEIARFSEETGYSRSASRKATYKKDPQKINEQINKIRELQKKIGG